MSKLSDAVAAVEVETDALKLQCDVQEKQIERQRGAITEGRAEREQLRKQLSRLQTKVNGYEAYFRSLHHGLNDLNAQRKSVAEVMASPPVVATIKERVARLVGKDEAA